MQKDVYNLINDNFNEHLVTFNNCLQSQFKNIELAAKLIAEAFKVNHKLLICGNGGSASDSQHFAAEFTGRYEMERRSLPAIALSTDTSALTAIANDYSFDMVFAKQVLALGNSNDILFAISTSGNSLNVIKAIEAAQEKSMHVITLTGKDGGKIIHNFNKNIIHININHNRTARVQEMHILILHTLCDIIDNLMFKQ